MATVIGHVVAVCNCPARIVLVLSIGPDETECPVCKVKRSIKKLIYVVKETESGPAAEIEVEFDEPMVKLGLAAPGERFQS